MSEQSTTSTVVDRPDARMSAIEQGAAVEQPEAPYTAFSKRMKLFIVCTVSMAGFFSPFSINVFIPALPQISQVSLQGSVNGLA